MGYQHRLRLIGRGYNFSDRPEIGYMIDRSETIPVMGAADATYVEGHWVLHERYDKKNKAWYDNVFTKIIGVEEDVVEANRRIHNRMLRRARKLAKEENRKLTVDIDVNLEALAETVTKLRSDSK